MKAAVYLVCLGLAALTAGAAVVMTKKFSVPDRVNEILVKNGALAKPSEYPEAVVIEFKQKDGAGSMCSGVLISPTAVLSAAHCAYQSRQPVRVTVSSRLDQALALNGNDYAKSPGFGIPAVQSAAVASFDTMDPVSVAEGKNLGGRDLMIIKLKADFVAPAVPISVANLVGLANAQYVRFVGFGSNGKGDQGKKLFADVDVASARCSSIASGEDAGCSPDAELFSRHPREVYDSCAGDSGGPVYVRHSGGQYRLIGVTSRAPSNGGQCGGGTFVTLLDGERLDWIRTQVTVNILNDDLQPELAPSPPCLPLKCATK